MKLPRWLVIGMLTTSVLSVLAAAGWWWVTWPERTAVEWGALMRDGKISEANRMRSDPDGPPFFVFDDPPPYNYINVHLEPHGLSDLLCARRRFKVPGVWDYHVFVVERGIIRIESATQP